MDEERFRRIIEEIVQSTADEVNCNGGTPNKDCARTNRLTASLDKLAL